MKRHKAQRTKEETISALKEQLKLLTINCVTYDNGNEIIGKQISVVLRTLFHEGKTSRSLLKEMGIREITWLNTSHGLHLDNQISECSLLTMNVSVGSGGIYLAKCQTQYNLDEYRFIPFSQWWNMPVILDEQKHVINRREIVHYVADTDGGAHVDLELDEEYKEIIKPNYLGWNYGDEINGKPFSGKIELICMRQIAFEVLSTIKTKYPRLID